MAYNIELISDIPHKENDMGQDLSLCNVAFARKSLMGRIAFFCIIALHQRIGLPGYSAVGLLSLAFHGRCLAAPRSLPAEARNIIAGPWHKHSLEFRGIENLSPFLRLGLSMDPAAFTRGILVRSRASFLRQCNPCCF